MSRPVNQAGFGGQSAKPEFVSAYQHGFRPEGFSVLERDTALVAYREYGPVEMLCAPHAAGDTIHGDFYYSVWHRERQNWLTQIIYDIWYFEIKSIPLAFRLLPFPPIMYAPLKIAVVRIPLLIVFLCFQRYFLTESLSGGVEE